MQTLIQNIEAEIGAFQENVKKYTEKGTKAAAKRARKASSNLTKLFKEFRKVTIEAEKAEKPND